MKRGRNLVFITLIICTILVSISAVYSWYINYMQSGDLNFSITQINSNVILYEAYDTNYNGVPDIGPTNKYHNDEINQDTAYQLRYYNETYYFKYLDQRYALSEDSTSNLLNTIVIPHAATSQVFTYKFELINYAGVVNDLTFGFEKDSTIDKTKLSCLQVRLATVTDNSNMNFTQWTDLSNGTTYNGISLGSSMTIPAYTDDLGLGRLDIWLQIRVKPEATITLTNFTLPQYRITLTYNKTS